MDDLDQDSPKEAARKGDAATIDVICVECGALMTVDLATGAVLSHKKQASKGKNTTLDDLASSFRQGRETAGRKFAKAMEERKNRADILDRKFREAQKRAAKEKDTGRPIREIDLD
jgi:hypothetical protein